MRGVQIILLLIVVQFAQSRISYERKQEGREISHHYYFDDQSCVQDEPDCEKCLSNRGNCEWCADRSERAKCVRQGSKACPLGHRKTTCEQETADDEGKDTLLDYYDRSLDELNAMDAPVNNSVLNSSVVTVNASVLCGRQGGCDNCTAYEFCFWCASKGECQVYFNVTKRSCPGKKKEYHNQCLYPSKCLLDIDLLGSKCLSCCMVG